jgi:hypothetical protein
MEGIDDDRGGLGWRFGEVKRRKGWISVARGWPLPFELTRRRGVDHLER